MESRGILGTRVDAVSYAGAAERICAWAGRGESRYVCAANVHMLMEAHARPDFAEVLRDADLVTAQAWAKENDAELTPIEREFLTDSLTSLSTLEQLVFEFVVVVGGRGVALAGLVLLVVGVQDGAALEVLAVLLVPHLVVDDHPDRLVALVRSHHALDGAEERTFLLLLRSRFCCHGHSTRGAGHRR